jgi:hypothetical protein
MTTKICSQKALQMKLVRDCQMLEGIHNILSLSSLKLLNSEEITNRMRILEKFNYLKNIRVDGNLYYVREEIN